MEEAILIQHVHKSYGSFNALNDVSFGVGRGEFFGLLGPNGAGKSTLISIMAGLTRASQGQVAVLGHDVVRDYRKARRMLGIVPQELVFDPFFTVIETLRIQAGYFGLSARAIEPWLQEVLQALDLADKRDSTPRQLSGGMKRRLLIAQALAHRPQVLILDEPTAGVDVDLRHALWRFVRQLHARGHTIMLTTHYLEEAEALCERIAILDHGRLKALASKQELLASHPFRQLELVLGIGSSLPPALLPLRVDGDGQRVVLRLDRRSQRIGDVLEALHAAGVKLVDLHIQEPDLEDVFLSLTAAAKPAGMAA